MWFLNLVFLFIYKSLFLIVLKITLFSPWKDLVLPFLTCNFLSTQPQLLHNTCPNSSARRSWAFLFLRRWGEDHTGKRCDSNTWPQTILQWTDVRNIITRRDTMLRAGLQLWWWAGPYRDNSAVTHAWASEECLVPRGCIMLRVMFIKATVWHLLLFSEQTEP